MSEQYASFYNAKWMKWRRRAADAAFALVILSTTLMIVVPFAE